MIESIKLNQVATYTQEVTINDLRKVNFVYGANGSGKTTISNFISDSDLAEYDQCEIKWINNQPLTPIVYNKNFRERNFSSDVIDGVFTLGEATKEQLEVIKNKEKELAELKTEGQSKSSSLKKLKEKQEESITDFKERIWKIGYKKHELMFKDAFRGFLSKQAFYTKILLEHENEEPNLKPLDYLKNKASTIFGDAPIELKKLPSVETEGLLAIESNGLWSKKIIGKTDVDISKLILKLNMNDWVNTGRSFIQENETCPFCQEPTITESFKGQLEKYFDEEYSASINSINTLQENYNMSSSNLLEILNSIEATELENDNPKLDLHAFSALLKTLTSQIVTNKERIETKKKEPSREIELISTSEQLGQILELITTANDGIDKHNELVINYNDEKLVLILQVWKYIVEENKEELEAHVKLISGQEKGIDTLSGQLSKVREDYITLQQELVGLTKNITSVQPAVDEMNGILQAYGFTNFSIVPSTENSNKYQIQRENGELVKTTLSEGEVTFITFLYFLQRCKGGLTESTVNDERILVIDDPISSLDSTVLFVVSSLIKEIVKDLRAGRGNIKQMILLTHNVYFHKEVTFIDGRIRRLKDTHYWIIRKQANKSAIKAYEMENPISTSYELLWKELIERENNSGITIQNVMRRILENYFKILGKYGDDQLIMKFESREDQEICRSLVSWINDGSHSVVEDLYVEIPDDSIDRYFRVFKAIFEKTNHLGHYNMMMQKKEENDE